MIKINGYFNGTAWHDSTRKFEVKTIGTPESGAILCGLNVGGKDKEGKKVYGKAVDVKINVKSRTEATRVKGLIVAGETMFECDGFFVPNNYFSKKLDKEVKGNQFLVTDSTTFKPFSNTYSSSASKSVPIVDIDESSIPF